MAEGGPGPSPAIRPKGWGEGYLLSPGFARKMAEAANCIMEVRAGGAGARGAPGGRSWGGVQPCWPSPAWGWGRGGPTWPGNKGGGGAPRPSPTRDPRVGLGAGGGHGPFPFFPVPRAHVGLSRAGTWPGQAGGSMGFSRARGGGRRIAIGGRIRDSLWGQAGRAGAGGRGPRVGSVCSWGGQHPRFHLGDVAGGGGRIRRSLDGLE